MSKTFTNDELMEFNGKDGKPAYVVFKGKVYDVTNGPSWDDGDHFGQHEAGMDLTEEMDARRTEMKYLGTSQLLVNLSTKCLNPTKTAQALEVGGCLWLKNMAFMQTGLVIGEAKEIPCFHALEENMRIKTQLPVIPCKKQGVK